MNTAAPGKGCQPLHGQGRDQGFTLLEVLIAIVVTAMVVSMVTFSISSSIRVREVAMEQGEIYYRAQVALVRISEDIASALPVKKPGFTGEKREIHGQRADFLQFTSAAHIDFLPKKELEEEPDVQEKQGQAGQESRELNRDFDIPSPRTVITYEVMATDDNAQQLVLMRKDTLLRGGDGNESGSDLWADEEDKGYLLCDGLRAVRFTYLDRQGEEMEEWDAKTKNGAEKIPRAVICTLEFAASGQGQGEDQGEALVFSTAIALPTGMP